MSTTLHAHPPHPATEEKPTRASARPTPLERLSLRLGLLLITYGRRRYSAPPKPVATRSPEYDALVRDLSWSRAHWPMRPSA